VWNRQAIIITGFADLIGFGPFDQEFPKAPGTFP
jgi:hypothetical protein